jgi:hypothetical protein
MIDKIVYLSTDEYTQDTRVTNKLFILKEGVVRVTWNCDTDNEHENNYKDTKN